MYLLLSFGTLYTVHLQVTNIQVAKFQRCKWDLTLQKIVDAKKSERLLVCLPDTATVVLLCAYSMYSFTELHQNLGCLEASRKAAVIWMLLLRSAKQ